MAYAHQFWKLTFGGDLKDTEEEWACGLHIAREGSDLGQADLETLGEPTINNLASKVRNFYTDTKAYTPTNMRLRWFKIAAIGTNGKYLGKPAEYIWDIPVSGSTGVSFIPSTATVVTLVANKFKDPGKYNRFYLPTVPPLSSGGWKRSETERDNLAENAAEFFNFINLEFFITMPGVKVRAVSQKSPIYREIVEARVGDIIDVQRRRRNRLVETYSSAPL